MSLRPSPSPSPGPRDNGRARQSLGPPRSSLAPGSPRPTGISTPRPTSELLGNGVGIFQNPETEALDQWFENLQNYEATLEEMAAASLDVNFKEELGAIEQWFKVLSEAERTAALYSLLQHSTQLQIRFFITVLQQMARADPMTALLSPAMGGSMQAQMEAKINSLKSPGLKSSFPTSPTARTFGAAGNRQSLALDSTSNLLSPKSASFGGSGQQDAASTLAQQRAKLKASNAAHRISAPALASDGIAGWGPAASQLDQVAEQQSPNGFTAAAAAARRQSMDFSGSQQLNANSNNNSSNEVTINPSDSWASMVNTPLIPMFKKESRPQVESKLNNEWAPAAPGVPRMGDPTIYKRAQKAGMKEGSSANGHDDNGSLNNAGQQQGRAVPRNSNGATWTGSRNASNRFGGYDEINNINNGMPNVNPMNMQLPAALGMGMGLGSPVMGMPGMSPVSPFNMNLLGAMGLSPEAQLLAAQMAVSGWMGMQQPNSAGLRKGHPSGRSAGLRSPGSVGSGLSSGGTPKGEEDVDPKLLEDIPAWLRSLRLHKYTPNFEGMKWQDMVILDDTELEAKGVAALGARRKMLKTFELVRKKMEIEGGPPSSIPGSALLKSP